MVWLKACPKCKGDLFLEDDSQDRYLACLQCGQRIYSQRPNTVPEKISIDAWFDIDEVETVLSQELVSV